MSENEKIADNTAGLDESLNAIVEIVAGQSQTNINNLSPLPWTSGDEDGASWINITDALGDKVASLYMNTSRVKYANARRIVECVNALGKMYDPINAIPKMQERSKSHQESVKLWETTMMSLIGEDGIGSVTVKINELKKRIVQWEDEMQPLIGIDFPSPQEAAAAFRNIKSQLASSNELSEKLFLKTGKLETELEEANNVKRNLAFLCKLLSAMLILSLIATALILNNNYFTL